MKQRDVEHLASEYRQYIEDEERRIDFLKKEVEVLEKLDIDIKTESASIGKNNYEIKLYKNLNDRCLLHKEILLASERIDLLKEEFEQKKKTTEYTEYIYIGR